MGRKHDLCRSGADCGTSCLVDSDLDGGMLESVGTRPLAPTNLTDLALKLQDRRQRYRAAWLPCPEQAPRYQVPRRPCRELPRPYRAPRPLCRARGMLRRQSLSPTQPRLHLASAFRRPTTCEPVSSPVAMQTYRANSASTASTYCSSVRAKSFGSRSGRATSP